MDGNDPIGHRMRASARVVAAVVRTALLACLAWAAAPAWSADSVASPAAAPASGPSYLDRLATFKTHLVHEGPSPQPYKAQTLPAGVQEVTYQSGKLALKAWVAYPGSASLSKKVPGVVFFHGGYAFGAGDFDDARPFLDAGFAVLCPMLRGENGNPGNMELALGEADDANAAVAWLASQPQIDSSHLYAFGFSAGGLVSAMLSLRPSPLRHAASAGGLYGPRLFDIDWMVEMTKGVPFDRSDPKERSMRVLIGNVAWLQRRHFAYVGAGDFDQDVELARREMHEGSRLMIIVMPGDHFEALGPAIRDYIQRIRANP